MSQKVAVIVKDGQNVVSNNVVMEGSGAAGKPLIVKAGSKHRIELKDLATHVAPDQVRVTKDGKNLKIKLGKKAASEDDAADIIIEGYFDNEASLIGVAENGEYYNFIPQGANYDSYYSLGGEVIGEETATDWMPLVLGLLGAGALAALASSGGGGSEPVDNEGPESLTIVVTDDVAPDTGVIVSAETPTSQAAAASSTYPVTDDNMPTISGVTEAGASVTIKDGATVLATVTADDNGNYTFTPTTPLSEGTHSITVTATDAAGNPITETTGYFVIDTTAPNSISMSITDDVAPITGEIVNNGVTDDTTPTFSGKTEAGATVTIADGTTVLGTVDADENGNYTFTPTTPLGEGAHSVSATATDAVGNTITSTTTTFTIDTTAPTATTSIGAIDDDTGVAGDFITNDTTLIISGTNDALDSGDKVQISLDGGATWLDAAQSDATNWSYDNSANAMTAGNHTLQSRVVDAAGNAGSVHSQTITIDTAAPTSLSVNLTDDKDPIQGSITAGSVTNDTTPVISGTTEAGATVTAKDDVGNTLGTAIADSNGNYTITPTTPLSEGEHYISVTAEDAAGNPFTVSSGVFTVDTTAPTAPVLDPTDGSIVVGTAEPGSTITITDGAGNPIGTTTANQNGDFSFSPASPIADTTVINATATDAAGNESQPGTTTVDAAITVAPNVYDDIAPVVGQVFSGDTTNDTQPTFSGLAGSVPAGVTVTIYDNGAEIGTTTSNSDGSWSYTPATAFADGSIHSITYTKNGGTNHSPAVDFTVDTTAPGSISIVLSDDVAPITGDIGEGSTTNDTKPTISGITEAGATVTIKDGTTVLGTVTADGSGNYSFTPIAPLNEGVHSVNATATDAAGNFVNSTTTNFTVDTLAPSANINITAIATDSGTVGDFITSDNTLIISGTNTSMNSGEKVQLSFDGGATWVNATQTDATHWSYNNSAVVMTEGSHTINARVVDAAGNIGNMDSQEVVIDTTAPTATTNIVAVATDTDTVGDFITSDNTLIISGTNTSMYPGEKVQLSLDGGATWVNATQTDATHWNYDNTANAMTVGNHTLQSRVIDAAGNVGTADTQTLYIAPPEVIIIPGEGQLINPVFVDGNYYYYWDRDGDGFGEINGGSDFQDTFTHNELDAIFMYDVNGNQGLDYLGETTDTYRYTELGGYEVALPTFGAATYGVQAGTAIDNNPPGEYNPTYDDLVAIWDAFNGGGTTTTTGPGVPDGWSKGFYWSATNYDINKHYTMDLTNGLGGTNGEQDTYWVAVQVIF
ncbi:MAG: Ig-like domain-containing protein [Sphaerochaetaceae bacterium]